MAATTKAKSAEKKSPDGWDSPATLEFLKERYTRQLPKHRDFARLDVRPLWSKDGVHRYRLCYYVAENNVHCVIARLKMIHSWFVSVDKEYKPLSSNPPLA